MMLHSNTWMGQKDGSLYSMFADVRTYQDDKDHPLDVPCRRLAPNSSQDHATMNADFLLDALFWNVKCCM